MINAGELNKQITLQVPTVARDDFNQPIITWADSATVWAGIITTGSREYYAAQKLYAETSAVFKIRYRSNMSTKMRIKYGNRYFAILGIADPEEQHIELLLSCKEAV